MKKILSILLIGFIMFLPMTVFAEEKEYKTLNLDEALTQEEIEHDFSKYKENDDQAIIYLFRGNGCAYCRKFLTFLNSIVDDYGKYFKVVSYEVWYDNNNAQLMKKVADALETSADGVPFIVIGDKYFSGYAESYDEEIKEAIMNQYESKNSYDIMKELNNKEKETSKSSSSNTVAIVLWDLCFIVLATIIIIIVNNSKNKKIQEKLDEIKEEVNRISKREKAVKKSEK